MNLLSELPSVGVLLLRLNEPERRNALATPLLAAVVEALNSAATDDSIRCVVITGNDKVFAAGADIAELARQSSLEEGDPRSVLWRQVRDFPKPLIAAVNGWCLGAGNELLMCCDLSVAALDAKFGQPETNLGIVPGAGGTATLPRLIGRTRAMRMVLLGEPLDATEALACGLVSFVVEAPLAVSAALNCAAKIASRAPLAMAHAKLSVKQALDLPQAEHLIFERQVFGRLLSSDDKREGIDAFLNKRPPVWRGA